MNSGIFVKESAAPATIHVRKRGPGGDWCLTLDDELRPISVHPTQGDALALAQALSRHGATVLVHELTRAAG